mgnify:CR=1 FL=1
MLCYAMLRYAMLRYAMLCKAVERGGVVNVQCDQPLRVQWFDLFLWAVIAGQPELATLLWAQSEEPLRAALVGSLLCQTFYAMLG